MFLILPLLVLMSFINVPEAYSEHVVGSGCSVSNVGYLTELAKDYERLTGVNMLVRGGGSAAGIEDLRSGSVDFAAACRHRLDTDPEDIKFIQVAWDALVFIVHKSNPVSDVSLDDIRAIYAGKIAGWKQLKGSDAPIKLFISRARKGLSGVENSTREMVLKGHEPVETSNTIFLASTGIVEQMVEKTAEGFATTGFLSARKRDVKMLNVNGIYPTRENISSGKYLLKRPLFLLAPQNPKPEVKKFIEFALSKKGQELISSYGAMSLSEVK
ncbi:MAG: substrate-binding domain-containing protein [Nitrospirae bacterium]|nr:substrate-binding domain-containing protein [Nitrospirota bacterium]